MSDVGGLLFVNFCFFAAGAGVTALCGWWAGLRELWRSLGVSYLAGLAAFGVIAQTMYALGASMNRSQVITVCAIPAAGVLFGLSRSAQSSSSERVQYQWLGAAAAAMLGLIAVDLWYQPLWAFDSWTFWTPKAHALYALGGLNANWFTSATLANRDYPILLPSIEAAGFRFTGYEARLLDLQSWLVFVAFLRTIYEIAAPRAHALVIWATIAMLVAAPSIADQLAAAEADIPVAAMAATAGLCGYVWLSDRRRRYLVVTAVLGAGASATKVEGLVFTLSLFAALAITASLSRRPNRSLEPLAAAVVAIAAGVVPWQLWLGSHDIATQASLSRSADVVFLLDHAGRLPIAVSYLLAKLLDPRAWLLLVPFACFVAVTARRCQRQQVTFALLYVALAFLGLVLAYWSTPLPFHYHLATSARRVVTGLVLFVAAITPLLAGRSSRESSTTSPELRLSPPHI